MTFSRGFAIGAPWIAVAATAIFNTSDTVIWVAVIAMLSSFFVAFFTSD